MTKKSAMNKKAKAKLYERLLYKLKIYVVYDTLKEIINSLSRFQ